LEKYQNHILNILTDVPIRKIIIKIIFKMMMIEFNIENYDLNK
jgi:hypothetical protein